MHTNNI